ncbi:hypothetical protein D030_5400A, partial [Vibrio parahaemolyticus AQ3810]
MIYVAGTGGGKTSA